MDLMEHNVNHIILYAVIYQFVVKVQLTSVASLGAVLHIFNQLKLIFYAQFFI